MRMLRLFDKFLDASERALRGEANQKSLSMVLEMMQAVEKDGVIMMTPPKMRAKMVPNSAKTVPNGSETAPNSA